MCIRDSLTSNGTLTQGAASFDPPRGITCNSALGYSGTSPTATTCSVVGTSYVLTGCTLTDCLQPSTIGYDFTNATGALTFAGWADPTGVECDAATGWTGSVAFEACSSAGGYYTVSGCSLTSCVVPTTASYEQPASAFVVNGHVELSGPTGLGGTSLGMSDSGTVAEFQAAALLALGLNHTCLLYTSPSPRD